METLIEGVIALGAEPGRIVMMVIGCILMYLGIKKEYEPTLLVPMGLGTILVNIPASGVLMTGDAAGPFQILFDAGIETELFPLLLFIGIGAMIDFGPLLANPFLLLFGAAGSSASLRHHRGRAARLPHQRRRIHRHHRRGRRPDLDLRREHAGVEVHGCHHGRRVLLHGARAHHPARRHQGRDHQEGAPHPHELSSRPRLQTAKILFPIIICVVAGLIAPVSLPLVGFLMFGNLLRECGVLDRLSVSAQNELVNLISILLGLCVSVKMVYTDFLQFDTLLVMGLGLLGFVMDSVGGVMFAKFLNLFRKEKINPMVGAAGISAFPMALASSRSSLPRKIPRTSSSCRLPAPTSLARSPRLLPAVSCSACCSKGKVRVAL